MVVSTFHEGELPEGFLQDLVGEGLVFGIRRGRQTERGMAGPTRLQETQRRHLANLRARVPPFHLSGDEDQQSERQSYLFCAEEVRCVDKLARHSLRNPYSESEPRIVLQRPHAFNQ